MASEFVTGTMVNGEGEIRVAISQFNNERRLRPEEKASDTGN